ncbi:unnamed protein product [Gordionus sp. m RMFG-2023]
MNLSSQRCSNLSDILPFHQSYQRLYFIAGPVLFIGGVIGNIIGVIVSSSLNKPCIKVNINKCRIVSRVTSSFKGRTTEASHCDSEGHHPNVGRRLTLKRMVRDVSQGIGYRKRRFNVNQYLLKWFFLINLFNVFYILLIQLIEVFEAQKVLKLQMRYGTKWIIYSWVASYEWNYFMANYNNPISKSFVTLGFLIYVLFFLNQMVAIKFPFSYKKVVTKKRLRFAITMCYLYSFLWYLPTVRWLKVIKIFICSNDPFDNHMAFNSSLAANFKYNQVKRYSIYNSAIHTEKTPPFRQLWILYQMLRELFTKILPFLAIMISKVLILRKPRISAKNQNLSDTITETITDFNLLNPPYSDIVKHNAQDIPSNNNTSVNLSIVPSYLQNLNRERRQHLKTMFILTLEFIFLLLPISISQMIMDILIPHYKGRDLIIFHDICILLELIYISCTFYINLAFNTIYREYVFQRLRL